jgi:peptide/nickel transport system substrate-binding protein
MYLVSTPLAATTMGLLDLNLQSEPVPGIAAEWEASPDLMAYTFKLRKGVLFHNGREVDAAAVQWNFARMRDPQTAHAMTRSALQRLKDVEVMDKHTLRCHLHEPSASFPANVVYYPCSLIAPDSEAQADTRPIGCGPFKLVKWDRNHITELVRFEHYFETDAAGNSLPYLDGLVGKIKKEDRVRLTSLRADEVDLIDTMSYADAETFLKQFANKYQTWDVPVLGTSYLLFNLDKGPFTDKRLRHAAAHAIEREAIKQAVFYGRGDAATGFYAPDSPWHLPGAKPYPVYDPDKAKFLLRQAKAGGTEIILQTQDAYPYVQQTAEIVQAMWSEVGFKVQVHTYSASVLRQKRRDRDFHADCTSASYRFDPDGWYSIQFLSTAPSAEQNSGFHHDQADALIAEARRTADKHRRLELYTEIESIVNDELPLLYMHHLTLLQAGTRQLKGYRPAISGAFSMQGAGIRAAWLG